MMAKCTILNDLPSCKKTRAIELSDATMAALLSTPQM